MEFLLAVSAILIIFALLYLVHYLEHQGRGQWEETAQKKLKSLALQKQADPKTLLIEVDALLDFCFKSMKIKGDTMGERLKNARDLYQRDQYNQIWTAHKLRNSVVHEIETTAPKTKLISEYNVLVAAVRKLLR